MLKTYKEACSLMCKGLPVLLTKDNYEVLDAVMEGLTLLQKARRCLGLTPEEGFEILQAALPEDTRISLSFVSNENDVMLFKVEGK